MRTYYLNVVLFAKEKEKEITLALEFSESVYFVNSQL